MTALTAPAEARPSDLGIAPAPRVWLCEEHAMWVREARECPFCTWDLYGELPPQPS